MTYPMSDNKFF